MGAGCCWRLERGSAGLGTDAQRRHGRGPVYPESLAELKGCGLPQLEEKLGRPASLVFEGAKVRFDSLLRQLSMSLHHLSVFSVQDLRSRFRFAIGVLHRFAVALCGM